MKQGLKLYRPAVQRLGTEHFVLTSEGAAVLSLAEQMEDSALALERRLAGEERKLEGTLKVSSAD